jgi:hypothetical protein
VEIEKYSRRLNLLLALLMTAGAATGQQSSPANGAPVTSTPTDPNLLDRLIAPTAAQSRAYKEMDLLRRDGFSAAQAATVSLHVADKKGVVPRGLTDSAFQVTVNGTVRAVRVQAPGGTTAPAVPLVLLVFPPNDTIVHSIGVREAKKYFGGLGEEVLPWKVGILDANGSLTPFTNGRSQLVANLDFVDHTIEPLQYSSAGGLPKRFHWEGTWLTKAEEAIALMQRFDGPKVILAMNPVSESIYGLNDQILAHDGPDALEGMTLAIGGHIYVANVGGPDVIVPGGEAAQDRSAQSGNLFGRLNVNRQLSASGAMAQYRTSVMMQTAQDTMGGFSNSLSTLAGYIHRDLDENYLLTFDMTAADRDKGTPQVSVEVSDHAQRLRIVDIAAIGTIYDGDRKTLSKEVQARVKLESKKPVASPDFRITQHVDYFPTRGGVMPVLPMSGLIEWTGKGPAPRELSVAESVEDLTFATSVLDREVQAGWNGRFLTWERDGHLHPGHYVWRVAIHDSQGKVYSAVEQKVNIENPRGAAIMASSLILGNACWKTNTPGGMRLRSEVSARDADQVHYTIDPMKAGDCRVRPTSPDRMSSTDLLRTFVRLYPAEKLRKNAPESWGAAFVLRSATGVVEKRLETKFVADGGSGYLAFVEMPLDGESVQPGPHTLEVEMRGPGIHGELKESRQVSISPVPVR